MTSTTPTKAPPRRNTFIEIVIAVGGSLLGTWLTDQLDGSPSQAHRGGPRCSHPRSARGDTPEEESPPRRRPGRRGGRGSPHLHRRDRGRLRHAEPSHLPPSARSAVAVRHHDRHPKVLKIAVSPARLSCDTNGCAERVTVRNAGDRPLRVSDIEVDGRDAAAFTADPDSECRNHTLHGNGEDCAFTVASTGRPQGRPRGAARHPPKPARRPRIRPDLRRGAGDLGDGGRGGDPADDSPRPEPGLNLTLSADNVECVHQRSGAVGGKDALQVFVAVN